MSLLEQMLTARDPQQEGQLERELKNVLDYHSKLYTMQFLLDRTPGILNHIIGPGGGKDGEESAGLIPLIVKNIKARKFGGIL